MTPAAQQSKLGERAKKELEKEQEQEQNRRPGGSNNDAATTTTGTASIKKALRPGRQSPSRRPVKQPPELNVTFIADAPGIDIFFEGQRLGRTTRGGKLTAKVKRTLVQPDQTTLTFELVAVPSAPTNTTGVGSNATPRAPRQATQTAIVETLLPASERAVPPMIAGSPSTPNQPVRKELPTANRQPLEVGSLLEMATRKVSAAYPGADLLAGISGVVKVYLTVDEEGSVTSVGRVDGPQALRQAAADAARQWKFKPTLVDGQPVQVTGFIAFKFI